MADFKAAHERTLLREGGLVYSNRASDRGGETFAGITRKNWEHRTPALWAAIDGCRAYSDFPKCLERDAMRAKLAPLVAAFYLAEFWDALGLTGIQDQRIAQEVYDTAINCGTATAARFVQRAVDTCNFGTSVGAVVVDGVLGDKTRRAVNALCTSIARRDLFEIDLNVRQGHHYQELVRNDPSQKANYMGWMLRRVKADL